MGNAGDVNTGLGNSGNINTGGFNPGTLNTGFFSAMTQAGPNSGFFNAGTGNSGFGHNDPAGSGNSGIQNSGFGNSGYVNTSTTSMFGGNSGCSTRATATQVSITRPSTTPGFCDRRDEFGIFQFGTATRACWSAAMGFRVSSRTCSDSGGFRSVVRCSWSNHGYLTRYDVTV